MGLRFFLSFFAILFILINSIIAEACLFGNCNYDLAFDLINFLFKFLNSSISF